MYWISGRRLHRRLRTLDLYRRADNALFVPEPGNGQENARYLFEVVGRGGLGFAPFGMDFTGYVNSPLGATRLDAETIEAFARNYKLVELMPSGGVLLPWVAAAWDR